MLGQKPENATFIFESNIHMRWGDMDAMGHINNTVYFRFLEQVRCDWLDSLSHGISMEEDCGPVLINTSCTFLLPMHAPGVAIVKMFATPPGKSSLETFYEISLEGDDRLFACGSAKMVWIDFATEKSTPIPENLLNLLPV
ncbi:MAG: acyl-CoA thioesterase [Burkholderiales bacterium]|nr:acyl-CoA thioesterase [Burkholderiales bacterium]